MTTNQHVVACADEVRAKSAPDEVAQRFWSKTARAGDCVLWTGGLNKPGGYGQFTVGDRKRVRAHRFAYELTVGPIPDGMSVLHRCDTPTCVKPEHLFLGDQRMNIHDAIAKGRARLWGGGDGVRGERNHRAVLNDALVLEIRDRRGQGETLTEIAMSLGVSRRAVQYAIEGWKHVG